MADYSIDPQTLLERAHELRETYRTGNPFPHIAMDNFFPERVVDEVLGEFPGPDSIEWQEFKTARERKLASNNESLLGPATRRLIGEMNSQVFLEFLQVLTGIDNLILGHHDAQMKVQRFECLVGGLPIARSFPFQYKAPF